MTQHMRKFIALAAGTVAALSISGAVMAQSAAKAMVDAAKAVCTVGEQADGFLGFVKPTSDSELKAAVAEINAGRAQLYADVAAKNGVSPAVAGASAYTQVVQIKLKPGECYQPTGGAWTKK